MQPGFVAVELGATRAGDVVDLGVTRFSLSSSDGVTSGDALDGRDRGALDAGQTGSPLARDFVFALAPSLDLTLDGLAPGTYVLSGVFHDNNVDQGPASLSASEDGGTTFDVGPVALSYSTGTNPSGLGLASIVVESNGLDPVVVRLTNPGHPSTVPVLNGFAIAAPEPSTWLGMLAGVGMLVGLRRTRRR